MVEVELRYGQQDSGKRQVGAEPAKERLDARERSEDQRGVLSTHAVQYADGLHETLRRKRDKHTSSSLKSALRSLDYWRNVFVFLR